MKVRQNYKIKKMNIIMAFLIASNFGMLYLLPEKIGSVKYSDIHLILEILFLLYALSLEKFKIRYLKKTWFYILFPIFLVVISAISASVNYGQPLMYAIRAQRFWIGSLLMFYPTIICLDKGKILKDDIINILVRCSIIVVVLGFVQAYLGDRFIFLNATMKIWSSRSSLARLYISDVFSKILFAYGVNKTFAASRIKNKGIIYIIISLAFAILVNQSRMSLASMLLAGVISLLFLNIPKGKKFLIITTGILAITIMFYSSIGSYFLQNILHLKAQVNSDLTRSASRLFFINELNKNELYWVFGKGYPSELWNQSVIASGISYGYYFVDMGLLGIAFYYGLIGILWLIVSYVSYIKKSCAINKKKKNIFYFVYFVAQIAGLYSIQPDSFECANKATIIFSIILAVLFFEIKSSEVSDVKKFS